MNDQLAETASQGVLSTNSLAKALDLEPQSIRKRYSQTGSYFCLRPERLPNGMLRWPGNSVELLLKEGGR